jgi:ABC-2 type transport system ATP-binding protein
MGHAIVAEGLVKHYGNVVALDGLDLEVPEGTVLGVLGPNGAGKTTAVRILATLLQPDAGFAYVAGVDVLRQPKEVRRRIGLSGQYAAVDEVLTGRENLVMFGQLYHLDARVASQRANDLLARFDLVDAADRPAKTYSGGMRRRLDLAASLVAQPQVIFLDEPTTGLDPRGRLEMWTVIEELVRGGATLLLTTQYLEEADQLADSIAVIDRGRVIARGTSDELKKQVGGERVTVVVADPRSIPATAAALQRVGGADPLVDEKSRTVSVPTTGGAVVLAEVVRALDAEGVDLLDLGLHRPTLDDVFLTLTGHVAEERTEEDTGQRGQRSRRASRGRRRG